MQVVALEFSQTFALSHFCTQNIKCLVQKYAIWDTVTVTFTIDMLILGNNIISIISKKEARQLL